MRNYSPTFPYPRMDIERISYIFGSFTRRRQSVSSPNKKCIRESPAKTNNHQRSKSSPLDTKRSIVSPRAKSIIGSSFQEGTKFKCPMCKNQFVEPRVLPCLHTFCLKCLENLEHQKKQFNPAEKPHGRKSYSRSLNSSIDDGPKRYINCFSCGSRAEIPYNGVRFLPPNYSLQHQMVLATLNSDSTHLLCDLCSNEVTATSRCMDCAISFCSECEQIHLRQKTSASHEVLTLDNAREKGITKIRRQVMCIQHPEAELSLFCSTCYQVLCGECASLSHRNHMCEPVHKVAKTHIISLQMATNKAKALIEKTATDTSVLNVTSKKIDADCSKIQLEIEKFIEDYMKSIEEHKIYLLEQIRQIREEKILQITQEKLRLQRKIRDARDISYFLDDLLNEGSDVEILSFIKPMINKIEACDNLEPTPLMKCSDSIQFLSEEAVKDSKSGFRLYGVLTTQSVSAEHCRIDSKDLIQCLQLVKEKFKNCELTYKEDYEPLANLTVALLGTDFEISVWKALLQIKMGETVSYDYVAKAIGHPQSVRAVGNAVGKNPIAYLIPCHRVIRKNGLLGGFTSGPHRKLRMLHYEGVKF